MSSCFEIPLSFEALFIPTELMDLIRMKLISICAC